MTVDPVSNPVHRDRVQVPPSPSSQFSSGVNKDDLKSLRESVTSWTADQGGEGREEEEEVEEREGEGRRRRMIGPSPMPPSFEQSSGATASSSSV